MIKYILGLSLLFLVSCDSDDERVTATVFDSPDLHISTISEGSDITFHIEVLNDTIDNLSTPFPFTDHCSIAFDVNNNNEIDNSLDFVVGLTNDKLPCESFIIDEMTLKPCFSNTDFLISSTFSQSALKNEAHIIWDYTVPKTRFSTDDMVQFRIKVQNPDTILNFPNYKPSQDEGHIYLDQTFTASW